MKKKINEAGVESLGKTKLGQDEVELLKVAFPAYDTPEGWEECKAYIDYLTKTQLMHIVHLRTGLQNMTKVDEDVLSEAGLTLEQYTKWHVAFCNCAERMVSFIQDELENADYGPKTTLLTHLLLELTRYTSGQGQSFQDVLIQLIIVCHDIEQMKVQKADNKKLH